MSLVFVYLIIICLGECKRLKLSGGGRKIGYPELEDQLFSWFESERSAKRRVTRKSLYLKAKEIYNVLKREGGICEQDTFSFSNGWLDKFMARKNLSLRRKTTTCQKPPSQMADKVTNFIVFIRRLRIKYNYLPSSIIACDETAVWLDSPGATTVDVVGVKDVAVMSTGHEKKSNYSDVVC